MVDKSKQSKVRELVPRRGGDDRLWQVADSTFVLPKNYEVIELIGSGAYGKVVAARDTNEPDGEDLVAIKKMERVFEHKTFARRTLRELKMMRLLQHENVLSAKTIIKPASVEDFDGLYVVMELMDTDLGSVIKSK